MFSLARLALFMFFFFFNDTATTEIYTLSLHDALPILSEQDARQDERAEVRRSARERDPDRDGESGDRPAERPADGEAPGDRKSTRLNSSHLVISYAVFCLKKKKKTTGALRDTLVRSVH